MSDYCTQLTNSVKQYMYTVSQTHPNIGRLGAIPIVTLDITSSIIDSQVLAIQTFAYGVFHIMKSCIENSIEDPSVDFEMGKAYLGLLCLAITNTFIAVICSPYTFLQTTYLILKDPASNGYYQNPNQNQMNTAV